MVYRFDGDRGGKHLPPPERYLFTEKSVSIEGQIVVRAQDRRQKLSFILLRDGSDLRFTGFRGMSDRLVEILFRDGRFWASMAGQEELFDGTIFGRSIEFSDAGPKLSVFVFYDIFAPFSHEELYEPAGKQDFDNGEIRALRVPGISGARRNLKVDWTERILEQTFTEGGTTLTALYSEFQLADRRLEFPGRIRVLDSAGTELADIRIRRARVRETISEDVFDIEKFIAKTAEMRQRDEKSR